jgi:hypothetical protein
VLVDFIALIRKDEAGMETIVTASLDWYVTDSVHVEWLEWYCGD